MRLNRIMQTIWIVNFLKDLTVLLLLVFIHIQMQMESMIYLGMSWSGWSQGSRKILQWHEVERIIHPRNSLDVAKILMFLSLKAQGWDFILFWRYMNDKYSQKNKII